MSSASSEPKLPFVATEPVSVEDVYSDIRRIGALIGSRIAPNAWSRELEHELEPAALRNAARPSVLVEWWPKPVIVPGRLSWVSQMLTAAGGTNPLDAEAVKSRPITDDEARALDPDAVVIAWCGVRPEKYRPDVVQRRPGWRGMRALERVYCVPEAYLGRPGPRLGLGVRALRRIVEECRT